MKDIKNYEGIYAITEDGKVWSYKTNKWLKPRQLVRGYLGVTLYKDNIGTQFRLHRLVAEAYLDNPHNLPVINHKDENTSNNHVNNLEWATYKYNSNYGSIKEKICANASNKNIPIYCTELKKSFESSIYAAQETGIEASNIRACVRGRRKTAGGYHWRYV